MNHLLIREKKWIFFWNSLSFAYLTLRWKMLAKGIFFFNSALIDREPLMLALGMDQHMLFSFWTFFLNCLIGKLWSPKYIGIIVVFLFSVSNCKHWTCYFSNLQLSIKRSPIMFVRIIYLSDKNLAWDILWSNFRLVIRF